MAIFILSVILFWILTLVIPSPVPFLKRRWRELFGKRTTDIFDHYLESKGFYMYRFRSIPCTTYIDDVDVSKAFDHVKSNYGHLIVDVYQSSYFDKEEGRQEFSKTLFVLRNKVIIEMAYEFVKVLFPNAGYDFANEVILAMNDFRSPEKKEDFEINIITYSGKELDLKRLAIKPTALDIGLYYNDDFREVDELIKERLNRQNDKGIVLLHGLPGTGKTTYLRHLIGGVTKKVLFVSPSAAANLMDPGFIDLLIDNQNSILIIEDAENIMMDRKFNNQSSVSNLLNLSDGLLSDCLGVQIICTFNSSLELIDSALMRKGRLIARYEFGKLSQDKSRLLSTHLGFDKEIRQPMTIAEIANQHEAGYVNKVEVIGFRTTSVEMN